MAKGDMLFEMKALNCALYSIHVQWANPTVSVARFLIALVQKSSYEINADLQELGVKTVAGLLHTLQL